MATARERVQQLKDRRRKAPFIVEYHPKGRLDKIRRTLSNKWTYGLFTRVHFEEDPHEHPEHGRIYGTSVRNGTPFGN